MLLLMYNNINNSSARLDSLLHKFQDAPRIPIDFKIRLGDPDAREQRRADRQEEKIGKKTKEDK